MPEKLIQLVMDLSLDKKKKTNETSIGLTFKDSKIQPVHRWYPYVEGFSSSWINEKIQFYLNNTARVYDPFGGSGTTQLEASKFGLESFYSEINPFMSFVAETKINSSIDACKMIDTCKKEFSQFISYVNSYQFKEESKISETYHFNNIFPDRDFFEEQHLKELLHARYKVKASNYSQHIKDLMLLAISSIAVDSSNMTRRADLRRRRENEYKNRIVNVSNSLSIKLNEIVNDLYSLPPNMKKTVKISDDSKINNPIYNETIDLAITSPPYLNGTNYIRNTKLELGLLDFIHSEAELKVFREQTVCGGINDVSRSRIAKLMQFDYVEEVASQLDVCAYDKRIPMMVRSYFSDMHKVLHNVYSLLRDGGVFILDIGDSRFSGVHIPTDAFIVKIAKTIGFELVEHEVLAKRYSRDKSELVQVGLTFRK